MTDRELIRAAFAARENAYAPYSGYTVGAALLAGEGRLYTGCNIENASYGATVCAERLAIFKAVGEGERTLHRLALAAAPAGEEPPLSACGVPCGICLQVMAEFAAPDFAVLLARSEEDYEVRTLSDLLPCAFTKKRL